MPDYDWSRCLTDLRYRAVRWMGADHRDVEDIAQGAALELVLVHRRGIRISRIVAARAIYRSFRKLYGSKKYKAGRYAANKSMLVFEDVYDPAYLIATGKDYDAGPRVLAKWRAERWAATAPAFDVDALSTVMTGELLRHVGAAHGHKKSWAARKKVAALRAIDGMGAGVREGES